MRKIDPEELAEIEPEAVTHGAALHSPDTAVIESTTLLHEIHADLRRRGGHLLLGTEITRVNPAARTVRTRRGWIGFGFLVNAAGLHADRVARWAGLDHDYQILPFRGLYRALSTAAAARFRGSIYPAPDLRLPFLGLHITPGAGGEVLVGPTAIPAFGRENYGWLDGMDPIEGLKMVTALGKMLLHDRQGIRALVRAEVRRYPSEGLLAEARKLAPGLEAEDIGAIGEVGLRAQLIDRPSRARFGWPS